MKRIVSYGDSFVAPHLYDAKLGWLRTLSKKMNLPVLNKAVRASSAEYCMVNFYNDINKNKIKNGDVIILSLANPGRVHFEHQNHYPETASLYSSVLINNIDSDLPRHKWLKESKEHLKWYLTNVDMDLLSINHSCYMHAIRNCAENFPESVVILLSGWTLEKQIPLPTTNPPNFLHIDVPLMEIANREIQDCSSYWDWVSDCVTDPRVNHFSNQNLEIFADLLFESIDKLDAGIITLDKFKKNIFPKKLTYEAYLSHVEQGDLNHFYRIVENFQRKK
jgi:hypothetical protein